MVLVETVVATVVYTLIAIILSYYLATLLRNVLSAKPSQNATETIIVHKGTRIFSICSIICMIFFWIRSLNAFIYFLIVVSNEKHAPKLGPWISAGWTFYAFGLWMMLLSFLLRIDYTFRAVPFLSYSPALLRILYGSLAIILILFICTAIAVIVTFSGFKSVIMSTFGIICAYLAFILHFIFSILFSWLLFRKIFVLMEQRLEEQLSVDNNDKNKELVAISTATNDNNDNNDNDKKDVHQITLSDIKSTTRFALLIFTGIVSTYIVTIIVFVDIYYEFSLSEHIFTWSTMFIGIDLTVNATAIYLLFQFNNNKYKLICNCCHNLCEKCCIQCVYWSADKREKSNSKNKSKQEFQNLILAPDDNDVLL